MRYGTFLFTLFCQLIVVSGVSAQEDAGDSAGTLETLDPTMDCMQRCSQTHEMCVSAATFMDCINNEPACAPVRPRDAEIMAAFCEACGHATVGCGDDAPTGAVAGTGSSPAPPGATTAPRARTRPPTAEERERSELARAREICRRQRGIWEAETVVVMPDGTARLGVCRTPEGAELMQMIDDEHDARAEADERLGRRITDEERVRDTADRRFDDRASIIEDGDRARDARIATLLAEVVCAQTHAERISVARLDGTTRAHLYDTDMVHDGYFICGSTVGHWADETAAAHAASTVSSTDDSSSHRRPDEHPTAGGEGWGLHLRIQPFAWIGFTPLHPTLAQTRGDVSSIPFGLGVDFTVFAPLSHGWYLEGGAAIAYDWPEFSPYATNLRLFYHAGLAVYPVPVFSIGFGYLGSDRFRPNLQSAHSFHGGYLDLSLHFHLRVEGGRIRDSGDVTDPGIVISLRGGFGATFRPAVSPAPDGLIQLLFGFEI
ncbi:hypothetical protein K8R04_04855 [Candidatus Uhrbacteria bacterium]|nr:hypothetical protein [Candidatus Uhrbacteria bacterium]